MSISDEKKKAFENACRKAAEGYTGLYLEDAYIGDDYTFVALQFVDEYYTHAETFFDFYSDETSDMAEIANYFANAAKHHKLSDGDVKYLYSDYDEDDPDAEGVSQDDMENFQFQFEEAMEYFAASLAAESLPDSGGGYLIVAFGVRWNGASGYMLSDTPSAATSRSYEATFRFQELNQEKGYARMTESSHDAPMGAGVVVISLTEDERDRIENEMDVDEIIEWARSKTGE